MKAVGIVKALAEAFGLREEDIRVTVRTPGDSSRDQLSAERERVCQELRRAAEEAEDLL